MNKPVKPKKPKAPKLSNLQSIITYRIVSNGIGDYKLSKNKYEEDFYPVYKINLFCLQKLCKELELNPEYVEFGINDRLRDQLKLVYSPPIDPKMVEENHNIHHKALKEHEAALNKYKENICNYMIELAAYNVWEAKRNLKKLKCGK